MTRAAWLVSMRGHTATSMAAIAMMAVVGAHAARGFALAGSPSGHELQRAAVAQYLRHIYSVYFGLEACAEIARGRNDKSFLSEVTVDNARQVLKAIDAAAAEVGIDTNAVWAATAPQAAVTAEALKTGPVTYLPYCQRMGSLFRNDQANLQSNLQALGAKTLLFPKNF